MKNFTKTDNELIAEFMGFTLQPEGLWKHEDLPNGFAISSTNFAYDKSWNFLMPVIQKIDTMMPKIDIRKDLDALRSGTHGSEPYMEVVSLPISTPINEVYEEVVKFIKWYNK